MEYKGFEIIKRDEWFIALDKKHNQEIKFRSLHSCKMRLTKIIRMRKYLEGIVK